MVCEYTNFQFLFMSKFNPKVCLIDYILPEPIDFDHLIIKSVELEIPGSDTLFIKKCPDFEANESLAKASAYVKETIGLYHDLDSKTIFLDELSTVATHKQSKNVSFIATLHHDNVIVIQPILHNTDVEDMVKVHSDTAAKCREDIDDSTTREVLKHLIDISSAELSIDLLYKQVLSNASAEPIDIPEETLSEEDIP